MLKQLAQSAIDDLYGHLVAEKRANFSYNAAGQFTSISRYSNLAGTALMASGAYSYDLAGRLTGLAYTKSGPASITSYGWTWDQVNRITGYSDSAYSGEDATYAYDNAGQLTVPPENPIR